MLGWLQTWYAGNCDGDWEHHHGVDIVSLDNPGWRVRISLFGTALERRPLAGFRRTSPDGGWIDCRVRDGYFEGAGGPHNLDDILRAFRAWAEGAS